MRDHEGRGGRWPWGVVIGAAVVAVASIVYFWLNRPGWGYCVDGEDFGFCDMGVFSSNAIVASIVLAVALAGLIATVARARGSWRVRAVLIAAGVFVVLLIVAWALQFVTLEEVQIPDGPPFR
jgi:hypothetical protein